MNSNVGIGHSQPNFRRAGDARAVRQTERRSVDRSRDQIRIAAADDFEGQIVVSIDIVLEVMPQTDRCHDRSKRHGDMRQRRFSLRSDHRITNHRDAIEKRADAIIGPRISKRNFGP